MASAAPLLFAMGLIIIIISLLSEASANSGTATFYTDYTPSACYGSKNEGVMIAAVSEALWENGAACGRKYRIKCTGPTNKGIPHPCKAGGRTVTVKIVDLCPSHKCFATIDLSRQAFSKIADTDAGKIKIDYKRI